MDSYPGQVESMFKFSVFVDRFVHVEGSFVEECEGFDEPKEHLSSRSMNHYVLESVPFCSDYGIQKSRLATFDAEAIRGLTRHRRACSLPADRQSTVCPQSHRQ